MVQQRSLGGELPDPDIAVLSSGEEEAALTGQVHPCDPAVVGGDLTENVPPGQTEQPEVAAPVGRDQDAVLELVPHSQGGHTVT